MLVLVDADGFAEVSGYDQAAQFRCSGLIKDRVLSCTGDVRIRESRVRGHYGSTLTLKQDGTLGETWKATFVQDGEIIVRELEMSYVRADEVERSHRNVSPDKGK